MQIRDKLEERKQVFCCEKCMATFSCKEELDRHGHMCLIVDKNYRIIELPKERKYLEFDMKKNSNNKTKIPTFMVADFESILVPPDEEEEELYDENGEVIHGKKKSKTKLHQITCLALLGL